MKIGLLGLSFQVGNKGCEALSYAFLEVINKIAKKNNTIYDAILITPFPTRKWIKNAFNINKTINNFCSQKKFSNINYKYIFYVRNKEKIIFLNNIKECDIVFDFTAGDSFADIYGQERFYRGTELKKKIIDKGIPLVLGSQTIGPFNDKKVKEFAVDVIKNCKEVFVRDDKSYNYTLEISDRKPILTTDIAFELPYNKDDNKVKKDDKVKIGFNASGLLWSGGYTRDNQFGLKVDYQQYCIEVISKLLENPKNEVHLISHATSNIVGYADNDLLAAKAIKEKFPKTILVEKFNTAMDAKSYISNMDFFIGARMHATVASLSTKVPVVAFSYSRKFEGLFGSLNYPYVLTAKDINTNEAVDRTLEWFESIEEMKKVVLKSVELIEEKNRFLEEKYEEILLSCDKKENK